MGLNFFVVVFYAVPAAFFLIRQVAESDCLANIFDNVTTTFILRLSIDCTDKGCIVAEKKTFCCGVKEKLRTEVRNKFKFRVFVNRLGGLVVREPHP